jgi:hypothetical protein
MAYGDEPEYDPRNDPDREVRRRFNDPDDSFVPTRPYQRRKDEPFDEDYDPRTDPNPEVRRRYHDGEPLPDRIGQG